MRREWQYKSHYIRLEEHPNVYMARIFKDLLELSITYIEMGPKAKGAKPILDEAKQFIDNLAPNEQSTKLIPL